MNESKNGILYASDAVFFYIDITT